MKNFTDLSKIVKINKKLSRKSLMPGGRPPSV